MFHARICTSLDAFHLIAEVTPYNLQTLRQHVHQSIRENGPLTISLQIDPSDRRSFARHTAHWLPRLIATGSTVVEVEES